VEKRGFIREGYHADMVLVDPDDPWTVSQGNIMYKCGWSPFEGQQFTSRVLNTWVNGNMVFANGRVDHAVRGERLTFDR
jgi:dihydroorotase